ncbi:hypothetical protein Hypma_012887 [Hypsizygus marmoreus]|uniref:Uncharacterized protein n=1 Tax=Hypsizygus marmoreus TaxID=39966 RepID=A0A369JHG8_HYPMA|nr:hypothetical protein Hypma_012887 [Hypsizygus marmoreus]
MENAISPSGVRCNQPDLLAHDPLEPHRSTSMVRWDEESLITSPTSPKYGLKDVLVTATGPEDKAKTGLDHPVPKNKTAGDVSVTGVGTGSKPLRRASICVRKGRSGTVSGRRHSFTLPDEARHEIRADPRNCRGGLDFEEAMAQDEESAERHSAFVLPRCRHSSHEGDANTEAHDETASLNPTHTDWVFLQLYLLAVAFAWRIARD